jgi:predicted metal-dependent phosphoesterase TrpH
MAKAFAADLHTHSAFSDGDVTPAELVREAKARGLQAVALTDHDTLAGLPEALKTGKEAGVTVICGVEVSLRFTRSDFVGSLHYLLYFPPRLIEHKDFIASMNAVLSEGRGHGLVQARVNAINELFGPKGKLDHVLKRPLTTEEVEAGTVNVTRRHFAEALTKHHGLDKNAVNRLISNDSPAYVPSGIPMDLLKPLFGRFPIVRVLAHPAAGSFPGEGVYREVLPPWETVEKMLPEFLELGLDGLEVIYPGHTQEHIELLKQVAKKHSLLITGGSDFHDRLKRPMGTGGVDPAELDQLMTRLA